MAREKVNLPVPVSLGVLIQWSEHDRQDDLDIVTDKVAEILVVPEVEGALGNLEVRTGDRLGQLVEKRLLHLCEFGRIHDLENILYFIQEHDLFGAVHFWPITQKTEHHLYQLARAIKCDEWTYLFCQGSVLLQELYNAIRQLRVVHAETLDLVQGNEHSGKEKLVLFLQWQRKTINDGTEDFKKFGNAVESLSLIDELEEDVVDGAAYVGAKVQELPVYPVESCLEEVALSWIFRVEQFQQLVIVSWIQSRR